MEGWGSSKSTSELGNGERTAGFDPIRLVDGQETQALRLGVDAAVAAAQQHRDPRRTTARVGPSRVRPMPTGDSTPARPAPWELSHEEPRKHAYLGFMGDVHSNISLPQAGQVVEIPLYFLDEVVLFPGDVLPLGFSSDVYIHLVEQFLIPREWSLYEGELACPLLGVMPWPDSSHRAHTPLDGGSELDPMVSTALQVQSSRHLTGHYRMAVKAKAVLRFRCLEHLGYFAGVPWARVVVLEESCPPRLSTLLAPHLTHSRNAKHWPLHHPRWAYKLHCAHHLAQRVLDLLQGSPESPTANAGSANAPDRPPAPPGQSPTPPGGGALAPLRPRATWWHRAVLGREQLHAATLANLRKRDSLSVSFLVASNLPLSDRSRRQLLCAPTPHLRLRKALELLQINEEQHHGRLSCTACGDVVAAIRDTFTVLGTDGAVCAYVHHRGGTFQTVTLRAAAGAEAPGFLLEQDSWFAGFLWRDAYCKGCHTDVGWQFVKDEPHQSDADRQRFWCLKTTGLTEVSAEGALPPSEEEMAETAWW